MTQARAVRPRVSDDGVTFGLADGKAGLSAAWLFQEVAVPRGGWAFERTDGRWELRFPRPPVDRMEYLFDLLYADGRSELVPDPGNRLRAPGPFGDKSVIEFPTYRPPAWTLETRRVPAGRTRELDLDLPALGGRLRGLLWSSAGLDPSERVPLLVADDGLEYARYSGLLTMLDRLAARGELPAMRAALLHPMRRDEHYSASPAYARAMADDILPHLGRLAPMPSGRRFRVGMGASLGALAMLHCHRLYPSAFGGLFLQSGSFFHHRYDPHDVGFEHFQRIRRAMDRVHAERTWDQPIPVVLTCGGVEMNLRNNRAVALTLRKQGYPVRFVQSRDAHNWIAWRDMFDPHLVGLLKELWR